MAAMLSFVKKNTYIKIHSWANLVSSGSPEQNTKLSDKVFISADRTSLIISRWV